ncbi:MAG: HYR domain-containing protein [Lewinellaceae bacterium]|nr:HYR domain-containing protein [Lewinellaceae bacterium]
MIGLNATWQYYGIGFGWWQFTPTEDGEVNFCFLGLNYQVYDDCVNGTPLNQLVPDPTGIYCGSTWCGDEYATRLEVTAGDAIWINITEPFGDPCGSDGVGMRFLGNGNNCGNPEPLECDNATTFNMANFSNEHDAHDVSDCGGGTITTTGQDRVFELVISTPTDITIYLNSDKPNRDFLGVFQTCSGCPSACFLDDCVGYSQTTSGVESVVIPNAFGSYLIVADWSPINQSDFNGGIQFEINPQCTIPPCADEVNYNCAALQYQFSSASPNGDIEYCFDLDFGGNPPTITSNWITVDGVTVVAPTANPIQNFCYTFPGPGTYVVCYNAIQPDSCAYQCCRMIDVLQGIDSTINCLHGDDLSNQPTKVKWINGDIFLAATNGASASTTNTFATFSRYDILGNLVWAVQLDSPSVITDFVATEDNAILLVGRTPIISTGGNNFTDNRSVLAKIDLNGTLLFCNTINNNGRETFTSIVRHPNPGAGNSPYYILGLENETPGVFNTHDRVMLLNVDNLGTINWKQLYTNSAGFDDEYGRKMVLLNNGNLLLLGSGNGGTPRGYRVEVNSSGSIVHDDSELSFFLSFLDAISLPNNEILLAGRLMGPAAGIARYDAYNALRWGLRLPSQIELLAVDRDDNGHIFILGIQTIGGIQTPVITQITDNGSSATVDWIRHFNDGSLNNTTRLAASFDVLGTGNIVYAEGRASNQYGFLQEDLLLVLTDPNDPNFNNCFTQTLTDNSISISPTLSGFTTTLITPAIPTANAYCLTPAWASMDNCVCEDCSALFTATVSASECFGYTFSNTSTGYGISYEWDFGDGNTSTAENPAHIYANPGSYNVCLTVSNGECSDTECVLVEIEPPFFSANCQALQYQFSSVAPNGEIEYCFDLDFAGNPPAITSNWITVDGATVVAPTANPIQNFCYSFPGPGTYVVCYQATLTDGCSFQCCRTIDIEYTSNTQNCVHGNSSVNKPTKVRWVNGDIYVAGTNASSGNPLFPSGSFSRYDALGNLIWAFQLNAQSIITDFVPTDDDAFLLVGHTPVGPAPSDNSSLILKIGVNGNLISSNYLSNTGRELMMAIVRHPFPSDPANPYYIAGFENKFGINTLDNIVLYNVDVTGAINWKRLFDNSSDDEYGRTLFPLNNGHIVLAGNDAAFTGYFVEVDGDGNYVTARHDGSDFRAFYTGLALPNDQVVMGGDLLGTPVQAALTKMNADYTPIWTYRIAGQTRIAALDRDDNGNLYALGYALVPVNGISTPIINKIQDNGNSATLLWSRHLNDGSITNATVIDGTLDVLSTGNIVYADGRRSAQYGFQQEDLLVVLTDTELTTCYTKDTSMTLQSFVFSLDSVPNNPDSASTTLSAGPGLNVWTQMHQCVCQNCMAQFTYSASTSNCFDYSFTNTSTGYGLSYEWDFGDGGTSTAQHPTHLYAGPGTYTVCLTVSNGECSNTYCTIVQVNEPVFNLQCPGNQVKTTISGLCQGNALLPATLVLHPPCLQVSIVTCVRSDGQPINANFPLGTTVVTCSASDQYGNTKSCSYTVTVMDTEAPKLVNCPPPGFLVPNTPGLCTGIQNIPTPSATDNCTSPLLVGGIRSDGLSMNAPWPKGTTTVVFTVTDNAGNSATCSTIVTLRDLEPPTPFCSSSTIVTDPGICEATFTPPFPTAEDNCTANGNFMFTGVREDNLPLNAPWPIGITCITWTVEDEAGNTATCEGCISVEYDFQCPVNDTICAETQCEAVVPDFSYLIPLCGQVTPVETYDHHNLAIKPDGTLWAWGDNLFGQLGNGTNNDQNQLVKIGAANDWRQLAKGSVSQHSMAIKNDGSLWAWGRNDYGQLGIGNNSYQLTPQQVGSDLDWTMVAVGKSHTLALRTNGTLWACGNNNYGELGIGNTVDKNIFVQVGNAQDWLTIEAGDVHSIALKSDGTLWTWGSGGNGALGLGTQSNQVVPTQVGSHNDWIQISAGEDFSAAIKQNGELWEWGLNDAGQLGIGSLITQLSPVQVGAATDWTEVKAGGAHTLGLKNNGKLYVWGWNSFGQLGAGNNLDQSNPVLLNGYTSTTGQIHAGGTHSIAWINSTNFFGFGRNTDGELGIGNTQNQNSPIAISMGLSPYTITQSPPPGTTVGIGCHDITLIVADTTGSRDTCYLTFCVKDTIPPEIICPEDICEIVPSGVNGATINYPAPVVTENCDATVTCVPPPGSFFPLGQTTVVCTVTDGAGHTDVCSFVVEVKTPQFFCGQAIITCYGATGNDVVLGLKDIRDNNTFSNPNPQNANTVVPMMMHPTWTRDNLGQVFGIAIDNNSNVYVSQTTVYNSQPDLFGALGAGTGGDIYRLDATTGNASAFASLPNTGQGLGNICFAAPYNSLYATNWEDGFIYQIDVANPATPTGFDIFMMDDPVQGYAPLGQLLWGIGYNPVTNRLYFGRWNENVPGGGACRFNPPPPVGSATNEIYSVALDANGVPVGTLTLEITMPTWFPYTDPNTQMVTFHSNPVSDIAFSSDGQRMLLAERSMCSPTSTGAHHARVLEYVLSGNNWTPSNNNFFVGQAYLQNNNPINGRNTAGGVDYGDAFYDPITETGPAQCDQRVWATVDLFGLGNPYFKLNIYGIQGMPATGNNPHPLGLNSYLIDADGVVLTSAKTEIGDVEIFDCPCPAPQPVACDSLQFVLNPVSLQADSCCYSIDLINPFGPTITQVALSISTSDVKFKNAQLAPGFSWATAPLDQYVRIENPGGFPAGTISNLITFCLDNIDDASEVPQQLTLEWFQTLSNGEAVLACSNNFTTECPFPADTIEGCLQVLVDSVVCDPLYPSEYFFYFRVQNLGSVPVNAIALEIDQLTYLGFGFKPCAIPVPFAVPTTSVSFPTLPTGGTSVPLCIKIATPSPILSPTTLCISAGLFSSGTGGVCCTGQEPICLELLPCCDPCEEIVVSVSSVEAPPSDCCYSIDLEFNCYLNYFFAIEAEIITPGVIFGSHTMGGPNAAGWHNPVTGNTIIRWAKLDNSPITGSVAGLINFCLDDIDQPNETPQQVVLRYLTQGPDGLLVACADTLTFECPATDYTCISIVSDDIVCRSDLQRYEYTFTFQNASNPPNTANRLEIATIPGFGANYLVFPNTFILNPPVPAGGQATLTTYIYSLAGFPYPGNQLKLDMRLANMTLDSAWCCFESDTLCLNLPTCDTCACNQPDLVLTQSGVNYPLPCGGGVQTPVIPCPAADIVISGFFGCVNSSEEPCAETSVSWLLLGPSGLTVSGSIANYMQLTFPAAQTTTPGMYTLTLTTLCPGATDSCVCTVQWIRDNPLVWTKPQVFLQGPYVSATQLMNDHLRVNGLIPLQEPYTGLTNFTHTGGGGGEQTTPAVLAVSGPDAIVDWVFLELRSAENPAQVLATRSALVQRDGDVVDTDGVSPVAFGVSANQSYYLTVRHRNHLGVQLGAGSPYPVCTAVEKDFTNAPPEGFYAHNGLSPAQRFIGGRYVLWAGNGRIDFQLKYNGSNNDRTFILAAVGLSTPNAIVPGYLQADYNLDGVVKYNGSANDRNVLLGNVGIATPSAIVEDQVAR